MGFYITPASIGGHDYPGIKDDEFYSTSDCEFGCGCWMGSSRSGPFPVEDLDPFGDCPNNPITSVKCSECKFCRKYLGGCAYLGKIKLVDMEIENKGHDNQSVVGCTKGESREAG